MKSSQVLLTFQSMLLKTEFTSVKLDQEMYFTTDAIDMSAQAVSVNRKGFGVKNGNAIILN